MQQPRDAVIVEAVRTPLGRRNGKLKEFHPVVLASMVLGQALAQQLAPPRVPPDATQDQRLRPTQPNNPPSDEPGESSSTAPSAGKLPWTSCRIPSCAMQSL